MFDGLKNIGNLGSLMAKAQQMQAQMKQLQEEMAKKTATADAGGGMVHATVNGRLELTSLKIDKSRVDVNDTEMLEDVIVAAVHAAQTKASEMMKEEIQKLTGPMGLPPDLLPGT
jgi:DNA-binding YbaB/EbfC family protein